MIYTQDIFRKCQRLSLSDKEMMNIFINGLSHELNTYVILNQTTSFAEAENLAWLKDAVLCQMPPWLLLPQVALKIKREG